MDFAEKMQRCQQYVESLEEERRKIQVFERELPLCLELVTRTIEACRRELSGTTTDYMHGQSECSEQTSSDAPVLEEFIPIRRTRSPSDDEDVDGDDDGRDHEQKSRKRNKSAVTSNNNKEKTDNSSSECNNSADHKKKSDWLRSVQLWNQSSDPPPPRQELPRKAVVTEVKTAGVGGAFQPFQREKSNVKTGVNNQTATKPLPSVPASATSSTAETAAAGSNGGGGNSKKVEKENQTQRKERRCWSPELHKRFLQALQQLGGSHAATPKQIRELMKVDGLTNDEVKSHLQKFRLHTRRPSPAIHSSNSPQAPPPQFVVVGGIWVPPPEYSAVATTASRETGTVTTSNGIYAPVAAPPPTIHQLSTSSSRKSHHTESDHLQSEGRGSHSEGAVHSNSPSTSSSTHTTTNSPEF